MPSGKTEKHLSMAAWPEVSACRKSPFQFCWCFTGGRRGSGSSSSINEPDPIFYAVLTSGAPAAATVTYLSHTAPIQASLACNINAKKDMNNEVTRLQTFVNSWAPDHCMTPKELAKAGFFRKGTGAQGDDRVQCAFCHHVVQSWRPGDSALEKHRHASPACPFARGDRTTNVPLPASAVRVQSCVGGPTVQLSNMSQPRYETLSLRLASFTGWRSANKPSPAKLAEAGFFYNGMGDRVTCFRCGQQLQGWLPTDEPFVEHARWSPSCQYVIEQKGPDYPVAVKLAMEATSGPRGEVRTPSEVLEAQRLPTEVRGPGNTGKEHRAHRQLAQASSEAICSAPANNASNPALSTRRSTLHGPSALQGEYNYDITSTPATHIQIGNVNVAEVFGGELQSQPSQVGLNPAAAGTASPIRRTEAHGRRNESLDTERLRERLTCKICMDNPISVTFRPCGHLCVCQECSDSLSVCPICRTNIQEKLFTFLS